MLNYDIMDPYYKITRKSVKVSDLRPGDLFALSPRSKFVRRLVSYVDQVRVDEIVNAQFLYDPFTYSDIPGSLKVYIVVPR